ncbi:MAG: MBL fold metallo-hydrolase [Bryobacteraceae bacterium]
MQVAADIGFRLQLKFWGVRGSTPTPLTANLGYGGNTACLEIRLPNSEVYIFDGGSGARDLGLKLIDEFKNQKLALNFFLTHFHWDHIQGLPFFAPLYSPQNEVTFHSFRSEEQIRLTLEGQMSTPYFPVNFEFLAARRNFARIHGEAVRFGSLSVESFRLNHPQEAFGYRIESGGAVIVFASDLEHGDPKLDLTLRQYAEGADILVFDAQYTPDEYELRRGWGHSTWLEATRVARDSKVKQLVLFHHDPSHDDRTLDNIVGQARKFFENTNAAREGLCLSV